MGEKERFPLWISGEVKEILDSIEEGQKSEYIRKAIIEYHRNKKNVNKQILAELRNISESLASMAESMQVIARKLEGVNVQASIKSPKKEKRNSKHKDKILDFIKQNVEM